MNRMAIGYEPSHPDRPSLVFVESTKGVLINERTEPPRLLDDAFEVDSEQLEPGDPRFFDFVLDVFSTRCLIRHVREFDAEFLSAMLSDEQAWEALPRPVVPA
jgi:hypothetical protein